MCEYIHTVQRGETLYGIAKKFSVNQDQIRRLNGFQGNTIYLGQKIRIPLKTYIVKSGDTVFSIAKKHGISSKDLLEVNPAVDKKTYLIRVAQNICIPYKKVVTLKNASNKGITIVIDPGHGDTANSWNVADPGAVKDKIKQIYEKDLALNLAKDLRNKLLAKYQYNVLMTRTGDIEKNKEEKLSWRTNFSNSRKADYFVSVHLDSFSAGGDNKLSVHYFPSSVSGKAFAKAIVDEVTVRKFDRKSIKGSNFYVLRHTQAVAVLIEAGNIFDPDTPEAISNSLVMEEIPKGMHKYIQSQNSVL